MHTFNYGNEQRMEWTSDRIHMTPNLLYISQK